MITDLITAALDHSRSQQHEIHSNWVKLSIKYGSVLPESLLMFSFQRMGQVDCLIRCMEEEFSPESSQRPERVMAGQYKLYLSEIWITGTYDIFRILKSREDDSRVSLIEKELKLIRIPLSKHQIANDKKLTGPLQMETSPDKDGNSKKVEYSPDDPVRSHIMPMGLSESGSCMWHVVDVKSKNSYWLERRGISDKILNLID